MSIRIEGIDQLRKALAQAADRAGVALGFALKQEAESIMTKSKADYVPVDQGTLRASGVVGSPEFKGDTVSIELGYGGAASAYALVQHERLDFQHTIGQAKYLERPVMAAASGMEGRLAAHVRGRI